MVKRLDPSQSPAVLYRSPAKTYTTAVKSKGMYIYDSKGAEYLDMSGGAAVSLIGHGNAYVLECMRRQAEQLSFAHTAFFTHEPQEALAERIARYFREPGAQVYFSSGGSEANEAALKMVWQYWQAHGKPEKKMIISREYSYHGNTLGALSVSGHHGRRLASAAPLIDWARIPPCYAYRFKAPNQNVEDYAISAANTLEDAILQYGADYVAAFICEPVVGSSLGAVAAERQYLRRVREICDQYDVLLICDEIMCGSGRCGTYFAHQYDGVIPDIVTLAKGIAGGYQPLAATVVRAHMAETFKRASFAHGHTYIAHPVACAAGLAVLDELDRHQLIEQCSTKSEAFLHVLRQNLETHPCVGDVRGRGLLLAIELVSDKTAKSGFAEQLDLVSALRHESLGAGLICYPGATSIEGELIPHILLAPPLILERHHMEECAQRLAEVFNRVMSEVCLA